MEEMDGNITTWSAGRGGASSLAAARESAREDEQACEAGRNPKRRIEQSVSDDIEDTLGGDGKRTRGCDNGGASDAIVGFSGGQLHCSDEETQSLLFSSNPRKTARGNVLDPSGSGENVQQLRSFEIDPVKHKIFLSHSGAQKNFVEQLCVDLEARGYLFPFFDQRNHSLPKGKDFAPLIKQAARQCRVAVIVLSEKYLCSKWPMIELAEFHAAKQGGNHRMIMLPLFYKLRVGDLDDESIEGRWMPVWNELASGDKRIDVSRWAAAVRALRGLNGLPFGKHNNSQVGYRKEIVRSIWEMWPGDLWYDNARKMVGYNRICEIVSKEFVVCKVEEASVLVLGLYGTSGLGKTTVTKALCDYSGGEFEGRVCHVELGKEKERMRRQERMLKALCGVEDDWLRRLPDDHKGLELMKGLMSREPVLLVIDNLTNDVSSRIEAREYLTAGFHPSSKVVITARSKEVLQDLVPGVDFCMSIPKLNEEEAGMILWSSAAPSRCFSSVTDEERRVLRDCVEKCLLGSGGSGYQGDHPDGSLSIEVPKYGAYHPLALRALGNFFYKLGAKTGVLQWKDSLERDHELVRNVFRQSPNIMDIIRLQFSTFSWSEQLLFLDLAFYYEPDGLFMTRHNFQLYDGVDRLAILHGEKASIVESRLRDLKRSGMIDWDDDELPALYFEVHSLYREFAEWYMTEHGVAGLKNARGVFQPCGTSRGSDHQGSKCISDLVRLRVFDAPRASMRILTSKKMRELQNLVLLQLYDCTSLRVLSLAGLDSLRHLELVRLSELVTVTLTESSGTQEDEGIFESLVYVRLECLNSLTHVPDLRSCTSLSCVAFLYCPKVTDLEGLECPHVREMRLEYFFPQQVGWLPIFRARHCIMQLDMSFAGDVDLSDAMDLAIPNKWKRRGRGQSVGVQVREDSDAFSGDPDAFEVVEHHIQSNCEITTIYVGREKQFDKVGLSIVQNALSYLYEHGRLKPFSVVNGNFIPGLSWRFDEGVNVHERLSWWDADWIHGQRKYLSWRIAEEYGD